MSIGVRNNSTDNNAKVNIYASLQRPGLIRNKAFVDSLNFDGNIIFDKVEISSKATAALSFNDYNENETSDNIKTLLEELLKTEEEARETAINNTITKPLREPRNKDNKSGVDDPTRKLTRLLVAAKTRNQVHNVLSEAYKSMGEVIQAAAHGDEDAKLVLRKLNKLIRRATRKVKDLGDEEKLRRAEARAKQKEIEQLAQQLELELKRKLKERKQREKKYLNDPDQKAGKTQEFPGTPSSMPSQAQIKAMAWQAAVATISSQSTDSTNAASSGSSESSNNGLMGSISGTSTEGSDSASEST